MDSELVLKKLLHTIFLRSPQNCFDEFIKECQAWYSKPAHTFTEMRVRSNKKIRGDIFEEFCVLYLKHVKGYDTVWLLHDVPDEILEKLSLKRRDMGIDIIISTGTGYIAVQCKYKAPSDKKTCIPWKALSTFYALCLRTGPWEKYIVMTNCHFTRHQGPKTEKDVSMCLGTFRAISSESWIKLCGAQGETLDTENTNLTKEELRLKRLQFYSQTADSTS